MRHKQSKPNSRGCCLALLFASWFHDAYLRTALNVWWESQLKLMFTASNPHLARRAEKVLHPSGTQREQQENMTKAPATATATATWCLVPGVFKGASATGTNQASQQSSNPPHSVPPDHHHHHQQHHHQQHHHQVDSSQLLLVCSFCCCRFLISFSSCAVESPRSLWGGFFRWENKFAWLARFRAMCVFHFHFVSRHNMAMFCWLIALPGQAWTGGTVPSNCSLCMHWNFWLRSWFVSWPHVALFSLTIA